MPQTSREIFLFSCCFSILILGAMFFLADFDLRTFCTLFLTLKLSFVKQFCNLHSSICFSFRRSIISLFHFDLFIILLLNFSPGYSNFGSSSRDYYWTRLRINIAGQIRALADPFDEPFWFEILYKSRVSFVPLLILYLNSRIPRFFSLPLRCRKEIFLRDDFALFSIRNLSITHIQKLIYSQRAF